MTNSYKLTKIISNINYINFKENKVKYNKHQGDEN